MFRRFLMGLQFLIGISAVAGGVALIATNGLGMPVAWLADSPFSSYVWPGVILAVFVGGPHLGATWAMLVYSSRVSEALATAGFSLLIWVFTEISIIKHGNWLQGFYFALSLITLISVMVILRREQGIYYRQIKQISCTDTKIISRA